eukprot:gene8709-biopygen1621
MGRGRPPWLPLGGARRGVPFKAEDSALPAALRALYPVFPTAPAARRTGETGCKDRFPAPGPRTARQVARPISARCRRGGPDGAAPRSSFRIRDYNTIGSGRGPRPGREILSLFFFSGAVGKIALRGLKKRGLPVRETRFPRLASEKESQIPLRDYNTIGPRGGRGRREILSLLLWLSPRRAVKRAGSHGGF